MAALCVTHCQGFSHWLRLGRCELRSSSAYSLMRVNAIRVNPCRCHILYSTWGRQIIMYDNCADKCTFTSLSQWTVDCSLRELYHLKLTLVPWVGLIIASVWFIEICRFRVFSQDNQLPHLEMSRYLPSKIKGSHFLFSSKISYHLSVVYSEINLQNSSPYRLFLAYWMYCSTKFGTIF